MPTLCFERARNHALNVGKIPIDERGILCGLPITIKDLVDVEGVRTTYGSMIFQNHVPDTSNALVKRIENRGGIVYAKSNTPEFGSGGTTFNDVFGLTRSPRNTRFSSGGSSGGAAAALAAGCAWLSHGSDMAGSLRTPAAFCGVVSLRPSPGFISADQHTLPFEPLVQHGPMARNIEDLMLFAEALFDHPQDNTMDLYNKPVKPRRIAFSPDLGITAVDDQILNALHELTTILGKAGCTVIKANMPLQGVHDAFDILRAHAYAVSHELALAEHPDLMKPENEWNIQAGIDLDIQQLRIAQRRHAQIIEDSWKFMEEYDILICPATSRQAVEAETRYPGYTQGIPFPEYYRWLAIAYAATMTALPVVTLPISVGDSNIPIAVQLIGKPQSDCQLLGQALWIEKLIGWDHRPVNPSSTINPKQ